MAEVKKENWFQRTWASVSKWFRGMKSELKKVIWPTVPVLTKNTGVSVAAILVSALVLWGFDELAQLFIRGLFMLAG